MSFKTLIFENFWGPLVVGSSLYQKKILARNWPIGLCFHCVTRLLWIVPTMSILLVMVGMTIWKLHNFHCFTWLLSPLATHVVERKQTCPFTSVQNRSHPIFSHLIHEPFSENDNNSRYRHANSPLFERSETRIFISTSVVNKVYWQLYKYISFLNRKLENFYK